MGTPARRSSIQASCSVPCDMPPPRRVYRRRYRRVRLFTLGIYGEGTMFKKGGMGGAGIYAQLKLGRNLHVYGSVGGLGGWRE